MCTISNKLQLCSCHTDDPRELPHYWVLQKFVEQDSQIAGMVLPPADIGIAKEQFNQELLLKLLNDSDCFDKPMAIANGDRLLLHFTCEMPKAKGGFTSDYLKYAFERVDGKWTPIEVDPFNNNLETIAAGEIKDGLTN